MSNALLSTDAYKHVSGEDDKTIADVKKSSAKECKSSTGDASKNNDLFDMWIDSHYKLVYKVRVYDDQNSTNSYTDFGQLYKGGDKLSLFATFHDGSSKSDGKLTVDVDLKTNSTKAVFKLESTGDSPYTITATLNADAENAPVKITPPTGAVPLSDVINKIGLGDLIGGTQGKAADSQRQTSINSLDAHLEAAYASNGEYPSLAQLNDASWRATNMPGLDDAALMTPDGTSDQLAATATDTQYGYSPSQCTADGCQAFTVTALLSDGTTYQKQSFE